MVKNSYEQLDNEPASAFEKFVIYRDMGYYRSLRKAYRFHLDRREEATKVRQEWGESRVKKEVKTLSGQWVRLSKQYQWHKRADDFDWEQFRKREKEDDLRRKKAVKESMAQEVKTQFEGYSFRI